MSRGIKGRSLWCAIGSDHDFYKAFEYVENKSRKSKEKVLFAKRTTILRWLVKPSNKEAKSLVNVNYSLLKA